jgi:putative ABC transport system ATP-binding protein
MTDKRPLKLAFVPFRVFCGQNLFMSERTMLNVGRLTKTYATAGGRQLTVLKEVSFSLGAGASLAIVGPSGSGKTTLLGLCAGLDQPSSGTVELAGQSIGALSEDARALVRNKHVGFVFQNFQLVPTLTALENVLVPIELRGQGGARAESEARELLTRVGLGERCEHYPVQLSGGEQQRVALARAFMNRPKILFCDEPTGNLDGDTAHAMVELIFGLNHERQTTLVLVTHDLELAKRCQRILRLKGGAVVSDERGVPTEHTEDTEPAGDARAHTGAGNV